MEKVRKDGENKRTEESKGGKAWRTIRNKWMMIIVRIYVKTEVKDKIHIKCF